MRPHGWSLALSGSLALAGCLGIPPMKVVGGGGFSGKGASVVPAAHMGANLRPLAFDPALRDRRVDVTVGAFAEYADRGQDAFEQRLLAGPTTGVEGYPVTWPTPDTVGRLAIGGELRALYQPGVDSWGPFIAARIGVETAAYVEGCKLGSSKGGLYVGCAAGEGGIGVFAEVYQGLLDGALRYGGVLIVELRIPSGFVGGLPFPR